MKKHNVDIYDLAKKFAVKIIKLCTWLDGQAGARRTLSNQLIRSGTRGQVLEQIYTKRNMQSQTLILFTSLKFLGKSVVKQST